MTLTLDLHVAFDSLRLWLEEVVRLLSSNSFAVFYLSFKLLRLASRTPIM